MFSGHVFCEEPLTLDQHSLEQSTALCAMEWGVSPAHVAQARPQIQIISISRQKLSPSNYQHSTSRGIEHWLYVACSSNSEQRWILYLAVTIKFHLAAMCQNHCLHSIFTQSEECQHRWRGWSYRHVDVTITIILHVLFQAGCNLTITHTAKTPRPQLRGGRLPGAGACPDCCRHHAAALRIYRWQEDCTRPAPANTWVFSVIVSPNRDEIQLPVQL